MRHIGEKEDIVQLKKAVRREVLTLRDSISVEDKAQYDTVIRRIVTGMTEYREAEVILAYVNYKSEVETTFLIEQALADGKNVFAPKVAGREMEFWKVTSLEDLQEGYQGIREPVQSISFSEWMKACKIMMLVPGAVFDRERHRIGYGGGFYDRYLNRLAENMDCATQMWDHIEHASFITAALAYSCQVLEQIPHEEHDRKPDLIVTEKGIYR